MKRIIFSKFYWHKPWFTASENGTRDKKHRSPVSIVKFGDVSIGRKSKNKKTSMEKQRNALIALAMQKKPSSVHNPHIHTHTQKNPQKNITKISNKFLLFAFASPSIFKRNEIEQRVSERDGI